MSKHGSKRHRRVRAWVQRKIKLLMAEGKSQEQAAAQAISMARREFGSAARELYPER